MAGRSARSITGSTCGWAGANQPRNTETGKGASWRPFLNASVLGAGLALAGALLGGLSGTEDARAVVPGLNGAIAFARTVPGTHGEIFVMNPDGSGQTNLTNNPARDFDPAWSPDGTKVAFSSFRGGNREIFVMNADGSGQTNVTNDACWDVDPAWSPDGTRIAFSTNRLGDNEIFVMNADGSGQTNLTNAPEEDDAPDS